MRGKSGRAGARQRCIDLPEPGRDREAIDEMLVRMAYGSAGAKIVIQELLEGTEISLHALCDGDGKAVSHVAGPKRALDGDLGLNTGGMGTYTPTPFLNERN